MSARTAATELQECPRRALRPIAPGTPGKGQRALEGGGPWNAPFLPGPVLRSCRREAAPFDGRGALGSPGAFLRRQEGGRVFRRLPGRSSRARRAWPIIPWRRAYLPGEGVKPRLLLLLAPRGRCGEHVPDALRPPHRARGPPRRPRLPGGGRPFTGPGRAGGGGAGRGRAGRGWDTDAAPRPARCGCQGPAGRRGGLRLPRGPGGGRRARDLPLRPGPGGGGDGGPQPGRASLGTADPGPPRGFLRGSVPGRPGGGGRCAAVGGNFPARRSGAGGPRLVGAEPGRSRRQGAGTGRGGGGDRRERTGRGGGEALAARGPGPGSGPRAGRRGGTGAGRGRRRDGTPPPREPARGGRRGAGGGGGRGTRAPRRSRRGRRPGGGRRAGGWADGRSGGRGGPGGRRWRPPCARWRSARWSRRWPRRPLALPGSGTRTVR